MPLEIQPVTAADAVEIADLHINAFSTEFDRALFPDIPGMRRWLLGIFEDRIQKAEAEVPTDAFFKVVDTTTSTDSGDQKDSNQHWKPRIAGFGLWKLPATNTVTTGSEFGSGHGSGHGHGHPEKDQPIIPPECSNQELYSWFFGKMAANHKEFMGDRPHFYLNILAVSPEYQGRGCASRLLKWGVSQADEQGVEIYLSATESGRPVYEKYGFQAVKTEHSPEISQTCMIRRPSGK